MPLINTTTELKKYVEVSAALAIGSMLPTITTAERRFLSPLLGPVYADLSAAYTVAGNDATAIVDENMKALAMLAQEALANISMVLAIPRLAVIISDAGLRRNESDTVKSAYQYQEQNLQESYANAGFDALEDMLALLESNPDDAFAEWQTSAIAASEQKYFISSAAAFDGYYPIFRSRQTYLSLRYIMQRIENFQVSKIIGSALMADLKANATTDANKTILQDYLCPAIALLTIAKGLTEKAVTVGEKGVTVSITAPDRNRPSREPAPEATVQAMIKQLNKDGDEYLSRMTDYLQANAVDYPLYADQSEPSRLYTVNNTRRSGIYGV